MTQDLQARITTTEAYQSVFVDKYDDGEMWLSVQTAGGGAHCTLTFEQAREMIAAMNRVLATEKVAA
jgi:hypothetical protein